MPEIRILAENLKEIRTTLGESQMDFAVHCDISVEILSLMERQKTDPKLSTLQKISSYVGCSVSDLLESKKTIAINNILDSI